VLRITLHEAETPRATIAWRFVAIISQSQEVSAVSGVHRFTGKAALMTGAATA
jgi:hypothetical protein